MPCEYIFSLMNCNVNNQERTGTNLAIHSVNPRNKRLFTWISCQPFKSIIQSQKSYCIREDNLMLHSEDV
jgi:hypothetical protein